MKLTASHFVIALMAIVIATLSWTLIYVSRDQLRIHDEVNEEEIQTQTNASVEDGRAIVRVDGESQTASGIRVLALKAAQNESAVPVYGTVMDPKPLLDLRGKYLAASGERRALREEAETAKTEYQRAQTLYRDDRNISEQALRSAESRFRVAQAHSVAADAAVSVLRDSLRNSWGSVVGAWATDPGSSSLQALLTQRSLLVQLVFPYELPRSSARSRISLAPVSVHGEQIAARFISDSPQVSSALPGNTYFYLVKGDNLRVGTRVVARVSTDTAASDGIVVPNEAVVWHAGKAWVYVKRDAETFARYEISTASELAEGWFQIGLLQSGDEVVVSGAQLLLSEELKFQIRNENED